MPPKRNQQPPSESESDDGMDMGMDLMRFANPNFAREFKAKLPTEIRDRVKALEGLDDEYKKLKLEMSREVEAIEREFLKDIAPLCARRAKIVNGEEEPTEKEIADGTKVFVEKNDDASEEKLQEGKPADEAAKGVPSFWLEALMHHVIISEFISERDQEALKSITDITCEVGTEAGEDDKKKDFFTIVFTFAPNDFFTNKTLSKKFIMEQQQDDVVLSHAEGTKVEWKEDKNLGVEIVTKKIKSKAKKGQVKTVSSEEPCATFFDFFKAEEEDDEEEWMALGQTLKDKIIPFATNYFTGEAPNGESDMEDDEDEDEEEEEEEEEEDMPPMRGRGRGGYSSAPAPKRGGGGRGGAAGGDQKDCKQQ